MFTFPLIRIFCNRLSHERVCFEHETTICRNKLGNSQRQELPPTWWQADISRQCLNWYCNYRMEPTRNSSAAGITPSHDIWVVYCVSNLFVNAYIKICKLGTSILMITISRFCKRKRFWASQCTSSGYIRSWCIVTDTIHTHSAMD